MGGEGRKAGAASRWTVAPGTGDMGREKRVKIEREAVSTGERWGSIGDRSGGREKWNEQSRKRYKKLWD